MTRNMVWVQFMAAAICNRPADDISYAAKVADAALEQYMRRYLTEQRAYEYENDSL